MTSSGRADLTGKYGKEIHVREATHRGGEVEIWMVLCCLVPSRGNYWIRCTGQRIALIAPGGPQ